MDLFNKRRVAELEAEVARLQVNLRNEAHAHTVEETKLRNQVEYLVRTIRDMDDQIYRIGERADGTWASVQPNFKTLHDGMTARKVAESNRIGDILRPQLIETYKPSTVESRRLGK